MVWYSHICFLCEPRDYSPPGSSVHVDSPGKNTGVGCHSLLQRIFPTQEPGCPALQADSLLSERPGKPQLKQYSAGIKTRHITNGTEDFRKASPQLHGQLFINKGVKNTQWEGIISSINGVGKIGYPQAKE